MADLVDSSALIQYSSSSAYISARDNQIKKYEGGKLDPSGSGLFVPYPDGANYINLNIGYGFKINGKTVASIINYLSGAGIFQNLTLVQQADLMVTLNDYSSGIIDEATAQAQITPVLNLTQVAVTVY